MMRCLLAPGCWVVLGTCGMLGSFAEAQIMQPQRVIALTGQVAPGTSGATFRSFDSAPWLDAQGQPTFYAHLNFGPGIDNSNDDGIWGPTASSDYGLIIRDGSPVPGLDPGWRFSSLDWFTSNAAGVLALTAQTANDQTPASGSGIWTFSPSGTTSVVAREKDVAPGTGGAVFGPFGINRSATAQVRLSRTGRVAFQAPLALGGPTTINNNHGVWSTQIPGGPLDLFVRAGDPLPGNPSLHWAMGDLASVPVKNNAAGQLVVTLGAQESAHSVIGASNSAGGLDVLAGTGVIAPGSGAAKFISLGIPSLNDSGDVAFSGRLDNNDQGVWRRLGAGPVQRLLHEGDPAPGIGAAATFSFFQQAYAAQDGSTIAVAGTSTTTGLWKIDTSGHVTKLFSGDSVFTGVPNTTARFDNFSDMEMNQGGDMVITGSINPNTPTPGSAGLWKYTAATGGTGLLLRTGQSFTVAPGDVRTISSFTLNGIVLSGGNNLGNDGVGGNDFNDQGQLGIRLDFTDGSSGLFVLDTTVPEPGSAAQVLGGAALLIATWRRRHSGAFGV